MTVSLDLLLDLERTMKVVDLAVARGRASKRRRREIVPHGPGTGVVIDFPARERLSGSASGRARYGSDFMYLFGEDGWFDWPTSENPNRM